MRFVVFIFLFLSSLSSMASVTLRLTSENYKIQATLTAVDQNNPLSGTVIASTQSNGTCNGTFNLDLVNNKLSVNLVNQGDVGIGNCESESMVVTIDKIGYQNLLQGQEISVIFSSVIFKNVARPAQVIRIDR